MHYSSDSYRLLLQNFLNAGFRFSGHQNFNIGTQGPEIFLHHDIDVSTNFAVQMAQIESSLGIHTSYCFLLNSPFYNPLAETSFKHLQTLSRLGHNVGLHIDFPHLNPNIETVTLLFKKISADFPFVKPFFSWHRPNSLERPLVGAEIDDITNLYSDRFVKKANYHSDSNMRHPPEFFQTLVNTKEQKLNLLIHPVYWMTNNRDLQTLTADLLGHFCQETALELQRFGAWKAQVENLDTTKLGKSFSNLSPFLRNE